MNVRAYWRKVRRSPPAREPFQNGTPWLIEFVTFCRNNMSCVLSVMSRKLSAHHKDTANIVAIGTMANYLTLVGKCSLQNIEVVANQFFAVR